MRLITIALLAALTGCASGPTPEQQLAAQQAEYDRFAAICGQVWDTDQELEDCMHRRLNPPRGIVPSTPRSNGAVWANALVRGLNTYNRGVQSNTYAIPDYTPPERDYTNPTTGQVMRTTGQAPLGFY